LQHIQSRYTILTPISSMEQVESAHALATLPVEGHVVVDKKQFSEMFVKESRKSIKESSSVLFENSQQAIENLSNNFKSEILQNIENFTQSLLAESVITKSKISELNFPDETITKLTEIIDTQNQNILLKLAKLLGLEHEAT